MADIERSPSEKDPIQALIAGERVELTPENTCCIIHAVGKVAIGDIVRDSSDFDYIRIMVRQEESEDDESVDVCAYLFRGTTGDMLFDNDRFERSVSNLREVGVPVQLNAPSISKNAIKIFFDQIEASSFDSDDLDEDLNDLIDSYRRGNDTSD